MGVTPTGQPSFYNDPDYVAERAKYGNNLNTNQFWNSNGLNGYEPFSPQVRNAFDNPEFLWPSKQYMDISGNTHVVQRGYMRSLITAPSATVDKPGIKNRRLFFQFNPQILVRSVQQSVGTMNPLLQDPAQLTQPVPGTASFGFELLFNREHEVAAQYDDPGFEGIKLPDGSGSALTSKVGVLADILVLDTIVGQGISQDMLDYVQKFQRNQIINQNNQIIEDREALRKQGAEEEANALTTIDADEQADKLTTAFNANIGNSAFLNPLPFRVLFSSLFMVEGLATSVEVQFQKFSRAMVPTQCKVTINMYALYFGFAQKDTLLTTSLAQAAQQRVEEAASVEASTPLLDASIKKVTYEQFRVSTNATTPVINPNLRINTDRTEMLKQQIKAGVFTDLSVEVYMDYVVSTINTETITEAKLTKTVTFHDEDGNTKIPFDKTTSGKDLFSDSLKEELSSYRDNYPNIKYLSFRMRMKLSGKNKDGLIVESENTFSTQVVQNVDWTIWTSVTPSAQYTLAWFNPFPEGARVGGL